MIFSRFFRFKVIIFFFLYLKTFAQENEFNRYFSSPLDIPLYLSGNFGELRSTHFHSGVDFKTQQVTGKPVYSAADGYVSRIKVQASSYGKSIYITHPNGYTTVYAHLNNYIPEIAAFVKDYQYAHKDFEVDIAPDKNQFLIKKGQQIGISGNTGNSGGPHLHFEIRDQAQRPHNVLLYHFDVKDNISPVIQNLAVYPINDESSVNGKAEKLILKPVKQNGNYVIPNPVKVSGTIGFGLETYDYLNGSSNRCTIYSIELMVDDTIVYYTEMESFSFDESGYVASYIDYEEKSVKIHRLFTDPNNKLGIYKILQNEGLITFRDDTVHRVKITVKDSYKNTSVLEFSVQSNSIKPGILTLKNDSDFIKTFFYNLDNSYENPEFKIHVPSNALFSNINFKYSRITDDKKSKYSDVHLVHTERVPAFKTFQISLKAKNVPEYLKEKTFLAYVSNENKIVSAGGEWEDGFVTSRSKWFGKYFIAIDTVAPEIIPVSFRNNKTFPDNDTLTFKIADTLTGIKSYTGYIDGEWALFEYDMKNDILFYVVDKSRLSNEKPHHIEIRVTDYKNNVNLFRGKFYTN